VKTIDHIRDGVVARYTEANGLKLAVCVGFGRDYRPRVRFYRATAGKWTSPELVDRAHLAPLGKIEVDGPSRQHGVLAKALEALWTTPKLGFGPAHVALLVAGNGEQQTSVLAPTARSERGGGAVVGGTDPCVCGHAPEEHGHDPDHPSSTHCTECDCIAYESDPGEV
jgi:hypothetical protein